MTDGWTSRKNTMIREIQQPVLSPVQTGALFGVADCSNLEQTLVTGLTAQFGRGRGAPALACTGGGLIRRIDFNEHEPVQPPPVSGSTRFGIGSIPVQWGGGEDRQPAILSVKGQFCALAVLGHIQRLDEVHASDESISSDTLLRMLAADEEGGDLCAIFQRLLRRLHGGFVMLLMTPDGLFAARDRHGYRSLALGQLRAGYVLAPETSALDAVGAQFVKNVLPGELILLKEGSVSSRSYASPVDTSLRQSFLELLHGVHSESRIFGEDVQRLHQRLGVRLAEEHPVEVDAVLPSPPRLRDAAIAYAHRSGCPLMDHGKGLRLLFRRLYEDPGQLSESDHAQLRQVLSGRRLAVVDPSLVLDEALVRFFQTLRSLGVSAVHALSASPRVLYEEPCGIRLPELWSTRMRGKSQEDVQAWLGCDSLVYLSLRGLLTSSDQAYDFSTQCFTGQSAADQMETFSDAAGYRDFFSARV